MLQNERICYDVIIFLISNVSSKWLLRIFWHKTLKCDANANWGWSGGTMVLGKFPVPGCPTVWMIVGLLCLQYVRVGFF